MRVRQPMFGDERGRDDHEEIAASRRAYGTIRDPTRSSMGNRHTLRVIAISESDDGGSDSG